MKKMSTKNLAYAALLVAISVVLTYVDNVIPSMPQGGSYISFAVIPIFLASYLLGVSYGVFIGFAVSALQFALGLAVFYGPWSVALDYVVPLSVCGLAALIPNIRLKGNSIIAIGVVLSMFLKFSSHYLSGAVLFAEYAPAGQSPFLYSLIYNLPYNLITTVSSVLIVSLILPSLKKALGK